MLHGDKNHCFMELKWDLWKINQCLQTVPVTLSLLIIYGHINKGVSCFFKHWWKNNGLKMLVGTWEYFDPENTGRRKTNSSFFQRKEKNHEGVMERLFYEETKVIVKYIDNRVEFHWIHWNWFFKTRLKEGEWGRVKVEMGLGKDFPAQRGSVWAETES